MAHVIVFRAFNKDYDDQLADRLDYDDNYFSNWHVEVIICDSEPLLKFFCNVFYGIGKLFNKYEKNVCIIGYETIPEYFFPLGYTVYPMPKLIPSCVVVTDQEQYESYERIDNIDIRPLYDRLIVDIDRKDIDIELIKKEGERFGSVSIAESNKGYHIRIYPNPTTKYRNFLKWKFSLPGVDFNEIAITMRKISLPILFNEKVVLKCDEKMYYSCEYNNNVNMLKQIADKKWFFFDWLKERMKIINAMNYNYVKILEHTYVYYKVNKPDSVVIQHNGVFVTNDEQLINVLNVATL